MRMSDWSSDVCSSDLWLKRRHLLAGAVKAAAACQHRRCGQADAIAVRKQRGGGGDAVGVMRRAEGDRKSVVLGKRVSVSVGIGGRRNIKKKNTSHTSHTLTLHNTQHTHTNIPT